MEVSYKKIENSYTKEQKKEYWEIGIGLNQVDDLYPSEYLKELAKYSINGEKTHDEIEKDLIEYHLKNKEEIEAYECDLVSNRIAQFLEEESFSYSPIFLKTIHKKLFKGIFPQHLEKYCGEFRDYNIKKDEKILNGKTVIYGEYNNLLDYLAYDFEQYKNKKIALKDKEKFIEELSKFTSSIWQVHPFIEGNTRTIALFIEKYLRSLGLEDINNTIFKDNSKYFRNALVISNYSDIKREIFPNFQYLNDFFEKLIFDKNKILKNIKI